MSKNTLTPLNDEKYRETLKKRPKKNLITSKMTKILQKLLE